MKKMILLVLSSCIASLSQGQKAQIGLGYNLFLAEQEMKDGFSSAHGVGIDMLFRLKKVPFIMVGTEVQGSTYACTTEKQQYFFRDGSSTITDVSLMSNMVSGGLKARFECPNARIVRPYFDVKGGGMSMYSQIYVEDPNDNSGCKPLDSKTPVKDFNWYAGLGTGVKIDLGRSKRGRNFIDLSVAYIDGGWFEYANMDKVQDHDPSVPEPIDAKSNPVNVKFINISTDEIHEHKVANLYNSKLSLLQVQVKYTFGFGKSCANRHCCHE